MRQFPTHPRRLQILLIPLLRVDLSRQRLDLGDEGRGGIIVVAERRSLHRAGLWRFYLDGPPVAGRSVGEGRSGATMPPRRRR